jgi:hypothetical protein
VVYFDLKYATKIIEIAKFKLVIEGGERQQLAPVLEALKIDKSRCKRSQ